MEGDLEGLFKIGVLHTTDSGILCLQYFAGNRIVELEGQSALVLPAPSCSQIAGPFPSLTS